MSASRRQPRNLWAAVLGLALAGCDGTFYDGPTQALQEVYGAQTPDGTLSVTQTEYAFAVRLHDAVVDGAARSGFVSAFVFPDSVASEAPLATRGLPRGQIVALQGYFAERYPE
jgi:hypothetical protein